LPLHALARCVPDASPHCGECLGARLGGVAALHYLRGQGPEDLPRADRQKGLRDLQLHRETRSGP